VRIAEPEEQLAASRIIRQLHAVDDAQSYAEQTSGLLVSEQSQRPLGRTTGVCKRLLRHFRSSGFVEVVGELRQMRLEVVGVEVLQRISDAPVQLDAPSR